MLISANATVGTSTGDKTVVARGSTPAAGNVALDATGVAEFAAADAVTQATIEYIEFPVSTVGDNLAADSDIL